MDRKRAAEGEDRAHSYKRYKQNKPRGNRDNARQGSHGPPPDYTGHRWNGKQLPPQQYQPKEDRNGQSGGERLTGRDAVAALDAKLPQQTKLASPRDYVPSQELELRNKVPPLPEIKDPQLEECVFTHHSVLKNGQSDAFSYERLEFMGDAYIELIASRIIYTRFPHLDVGYQSQLRETLVKNETLSAYSLAYGFDKRLKHLKFPARAKDPKLWQKTFGDIFEAYIAALILADPVEGFDIAEEWLTELWAEILLNSKAANPVQYGDEKVQLQRHLVSPGVKLDYKQEKPYSIDKSVGLYTYYVGVYLNGWGYKDEWLGSGEGKSLPDARSAAAADALKRNGEVMQKAHATKVEADKERKRLREEKEKERLEKERVEAADGASGAEKAGEGT